MFNVFKEGCKITHSYRKQLNYELHKSSGNRLGFFKFIVVTAAVVLLVVVGTFNDISSSNNSRRIICNNIVLVSVQAVAVVTTKVSIVWVTVVAR